MCTCIKNDLVFSKNFSIMTPQIQDIHIFSMPVTVSCMPPPVDQPNGKPPVSSTVVQSGYGNILAILPSYVGA